LGVNKRDSTKVQIPLGLCNEDLHSVPLSIPAEIAAKCDAPNQAETFDRGVRAFLAVPKSAILKEEAKAKRRKKRTGKAG
jgi:hypothetical protein